MTEMKCERCKYWIYSTTLGSKDVEMWHCRFGFSPSRDCQWLGDYNVKCKREYYKKHPEDLQLKLPFG